MRLPGIGAHHAANPQTDEWLTPREILNAVGSFDLDPCAPHELPEWTRCARQYTASDDGLTAPWDGDVWLNPPYSQVEQWMARLAGHPDGGVALVFARTDTRWWFEHVWPHATALLFLAGRVTFLRLASSDDDTVCPTTRLPGDECPYCDGGACHPCGPRLGTEILFGEREPCEHSVDERHEGLAPTPEPSKSGHSSGGPSVLVAYGDPAAERLERCRLPGAFTRAVSVR